MGRQFHSIGCDGAAIEPDPLDYRLTGNGRILARVRCERGHVFTRTVKPLDPPEGPPSLKLVYLSGVAVGYAMGYRKCNSRLSDVVRRLADRLPGRYTLTAVSDLVGMSLGHVHEICQWRRPRPLRGVYEQGSNAVLRWAGHDGGKDSSRQGAAAD